MPSTNAPTASASRVLVRSIGWARHRKLAQTASALLIRGQIQNASGAVTVVVERLGRINLVLGSRSRDFR
jgi:error-prone DNA polymerase